MLRYLLERLVENLLVFLQKRVQFILFVLFEGRRTFSVMRSVWFQENGEPFEEKSSDEIDHKHLELYKDLISRSIETDSSINSEMEQIRADASSPTDEMKGKNGDAPKALIERM